MSTRTTRITKKKNKAYLRPCVREPINQGRPLFTQICRRLLHITVGHRHAQSTKLQKVDILYKNPTHHRSTMTWPQLCNRPWGHVSHDHPSTITRTSSWTPPHIGVCSIKRTKKRSIILCHIDHTGWWSVRNSGRHWTPQRPEFISTTSTSLLRTTSLMGTIPIKILDFLTRFVNEADMLNISECKNLWFV